MYAAIDTEPKLVLDVAVFDQHGTDQATGVSGWTGRETDLSEALFLVDGYGYRIALFRIRLSGQLDYSDRNLIEKWFHTLKQWIDRFHTSWMGSRQSVQ